MSNKQAFVLQQHYEDNALKGFVYKAAYHKKLCPKKISDRLIRRNGIGWFTIKVLYTNHYSLVLRTP